jgi:ABC-type proline/glycine betaine transport system ATPase subunit
VGVDPVLRQTIWDYMVELTKFGRTTIIVTTHYIDETRQAHMIGLMRGGKFLAEESPDDLLRKYQAESLEDVFLKLSVMQNMGKRRRSSIAKEVIESMQLPGMAVSRNCLLVELNLINTFFLNRIRHLTFRTTTITVKYLESSVTTSRCRVVDLTWHPLPSYTPHPCRPMTNPSTTAWTTWQSAKLIT